MFSTQTKCQSKNMHTNPSMRIDSQIETRPNRAESISIWVEFSLVEWSWVVRRLRFQNSNLTTVHDKHCMNVCVRVCGCICVLSNIVYMGLWSSLWRWNLDAVCSSVRGVPINCPNVQTSFVMRITKIEANHFANRILISNVSDSAVIRWVTLGVREAQPSNTHPKTQTPNPTIHNLC